MTIPLFRCDRLSMLPRLLQVLVVIRSLHSRRVKPEGNKTRPAPGRVLLCVSTYPTASEFTRWRSRLKPMTPASLRPQACYDDTNEMCTVCRLGRIPHLDETWKRECSFQQSLLLEVPFLCTKETDKLSMVHKYLLEITEQRSTVFHHSK
ncbi:hypothetical protein OE88DRAFT_1187441 [Heliocybe sulcata]|uniref:Uncharacterized protein n=1 Tax=Heliocybe sulcata TaxID=5364 RepID=A0A5C3NAG1_9AGAM|nr:hypothetical protein OE88DRAFT_1187441 [Heliocybe sulcata]